VTGHPTSHFAAGTVASFRIWRGSRRLGCAGPGLKNRDSELIKIGGAEHIIEVAVDGIHESPNTRRVKVEKANVLAEFSSVEN
jgi:hypothetical protein